MKKIMDDYYLLYDDYDDYYDDYDDYDDEPSSFVTNFDLRDEEIFVKTINSFNIIVEDEVFWIDKVFNNTNKDNDVDSFSLHTKQHFRLPEFWKIYNKINKKRRIT